MIVAKALAGLVGSGLVLTLGLPILFANPAVALATNATVVGSVSCGGSVAPAGYKLDAEQTAHAGIIVTTVQALGLPQRAAVIAIATALQESGLHNVNHGDAVGPDSRGLFQQRASWGPESVRMDPAGATKLFLAVLVKVPLWDRLPLGVVAQAVQHSADPTGSWYANHEAEATAIVASFKPHACTSGGATAPGSGDIHCCAASTRTVAPLFAWVPAGGFPTYGYAPGNCTWYAAYQHKVNNWAGHGDGGDWYGDAITDHLATSKVPSVGAVAVYAKNMGYSQYGHVAVVKGIFDATHFVVSEMNYVGLGIVSERIATTADPALLGFIV